MTDISEVGSEVVGIVERALAEDLASGDVTARVTVPAGTTSRARMVAKAPLVVAGMAVARAVFSRVDPSIVVEAVVGDGTAVTPGTVLMTLSGDSRALLAGERTALNLLQRMCGVATLTRAYVDAAGGSLPDLRHPQDDAGAARARPLRGALRRGAQPSQRPRRGGADQGEPCAGGGRGRGGGAARARLHAPHTLRIECEVTSHAELRVALDGRRRRGAARQHGRRGGPRGGGDRRRAGQVEVSGGVGLERISALAELGIDVISVGKLTHSAPASDISLLFQLG
jgi:nicotinate-nucleotide pyrophosphorylase (carboxylating)